jgi:hypothetical protein
MFKKNKDKSKRNSINITDFSHNLDKVNFKPDFRDDFRDNFRDNFRDSNSNSSRSSSYDSEILTRHIDVYSDIDIDETKDNFKKLKEKFDTPKHVEKKSNTFVCETCNMSSSNSQFIILNCNHIFHINCLAKIQLTDAMNCQIIDNDTFFNKIKCSTCNDQLESSEIMMIQNKFYKGTSIFITNHNKTINKLESQINNLKEEMKVCMEYKQKLEYEQQKSKQILTLLNNLPI